MCERSLCAVLAAPASFPPARPRLLFSSCGCDREWIGDRHAEEACCSLPSLSLDHPGLGLRWRQAYSSPGAVQREVAHAICRVVCAARRQETVTRHGRMKPAREAGESWLTHARLAADGVLRHPEPTMRARICNFHGPRRSPELLSLQFRATDLR